MNSTLEIQRFWAKNIDPITSDVQSNAPDSTSSHVEGSNDIIRPDLQSEDFCTRCNSRFRIEDNHSTACKFHANYDGEPGVFANIEKIDDLTKQKTILQAWSCCEKPHFHAQGKQCHSNHFIRFFIVVIS
jgi:hypothetical protein